MQYIFDETKHCQLRLAFLSLPLPTTSSLSKIQPLVQQMTSEFISLNHVNVQEEEEEDEQKEEKPEGGGGGKPKVKEEEEEGKNKKIKKRTRKIMTSSITMTNKMVLRSLIICLRQRTEMKPHSLQRRTHKRTHSFQTPRFGFYKRLLASMQLPFLVYLLYYILIRNLGYSYRVGNEHLPLDTFPWTYTTHQIPPQC